MLKTKALLFTTCALALAVSLACAGKKAVRYGKQKIGPGSAVVVVVDCPTNIQNVVLAKFMEKDYRVKAFNASDLYAMRDVYDIRDFKKIAQESSLNDQGSPFNIQKAHDNLYKLTIYNYEMQKAETLGEMKERYNVRYLILFELNDWERVSWGRAIDLASYELVWLENYPTRYSDTIESIIDHFITSLSGM
ncbi:MAG TPA: hypothetical protein PKO25_12570 [Spirochaetota bacterium]|nr:hypothetical protein [Spirochaetota bacterium]OPZ35697.1 MAG: hypothetical protein BWY96_02619 [Spirochaetes bacterium ADurb.BinA120]HNU92697.1 hypothetical protein [Spirochaetota bacterium]HPI14188.1 hypothetical protein [Spirochaetota bacterium]